MTVPRFHDSLLAEHLASNRQMAFFSGPRQVGKTTTCRLRADAYVNWDDIDDRELILAGPRNPAAGLGLDRLSETVPVVLFDELHKFPRWKQFLKGFFDTHADRVRIAVAGSSRMDVYRRGGDSLMGRYFPYRMHPFSIAETLTRELPDATRIVRSPRPIDEDDFDALWRHGGYPEPFVRRDARFSRRWQSLRLEQLVREGIRDLTQIQQLDQLALMVAPWFLAEVKYSDGPPSPSLRRYQDQVGAPFAFQVTMDADYVDEDCFAKPGGPLIVPARTFLSQLL